MAGGGVPVVDISDFPAQLKRLREACEGWGCLRIINHGVPADLMSEMKSVAMSLLDLPTEIKLRNVDVIPSSGYMAPSPLNPLYEALGLYDVGSSLAVDSFCSQLQVSPHQRKTIESETVGSPGVQVHTDSGFLTVLQDDEDVGGLEVMDPSGSFVPIDPSPGTLVVNLGDIGTAWSNGRLRNVQHRVQCKEATLRFSIATFMAPPKDMVLEAPAVFVDAKHPRLYSSFTYEEFREIRASTKKHVGDALSLVQNKV
ncbi:hypothetical protein Dimus_013986 [Dionaea muscipula]